MFNRGGREAEGPVSVEIVLEDGQELWGKLVIPPGRTLPDVLNGGTSFIEFEAAEGERMFIAKSALHTVKPMHLPAAPDLWAGPTEGAGFNPFAILGIKPGATREETREAYLRLAKSYHPDRYAASELPREVQEYLSVMARRVNAAYDTIETGRRKQAAKAGPVFTKAGQA
jgi:DnaJ domain